MSNATQEMDEANARYDAALKRTCRRLAHRSRVRSQPRGTTAIICENRLERGTLTSPLAPRAQAPQE